MGVTGKTSRVWAGLFSIGFGVMIAGRSGATEGNSQGTLAESWRPLTLVQVFNPADSGEKPRDGAQTSPPPAEPGHVGTWQLPPVRVVGEAPAELREEDKVGSYAQPRWTADRRFAGTRTYVIPENKVEAEYWFNPETPRHAKTDFKSLYEVEIGLPHRLQLDLYLRTDQGIEKDKTLVGQSFEIRYALADWGKIWGNPTFYLEYSRQDDQPDLLEGKLLLTGELAPRWHWGVNLSTEWALSGDLSREYEITTGVSYTLIDEKLSVGGEIEASLVDLKNHRGDFEKQFKIGPSLQWRPTPRIHVDFAPLFGLTADSPMARVYLILGYEF